MVVQGPVDCAVEGDVEGEWWGPAGGANFGVVECVPVVVAGPGGVIVDRVDVEGFAEGVGDGGGDLVDIVFLSGDVPPVGSWGVVVVVINNK